MDGLQQTLELKGIVRGAHTQMPARTAVQNSTAQSLLARADLTRQQWKVLGLEAQRRGWEELGMQIASSQESSIDSRKHLADSTKEFRKLPDEEKMRSWGPLLKSYQGEVDSLTKRSKVAESAIISVYKLFQDVLDPSQIIESLTEELKRLLAMETAHEKVVKELTEYKEEFATLKNQEVTIRTLQEQNNVLQQQVREPVQPMA